MMDEWSKKNQEDGMEEQQKFKDQHSFLRNPRFLPPTERQSGTSLIRAKVMKKCARKGSEAQRYHNEPNIKTIYGFIVIVYHHYKRHQNKSPY